MKNNKEFSIEEMLKIAEVESLMEYNKWSKEIPYLNFPKDWNVKIIPPSNWAVIRFMVKRVGGDKKISIYLDCYDKLGIYGEPYWEIYPYDNDTFRCPMNETNELLNAIERALGNKRAVLNKILT